MTPFQMASIIVQFYPWAPDAGDILNQLAAQRGEPHASDLLGFADTTLSRPSVQTGTAAKHGTAQQDQKPASQLLSIDGSRSPSAAVVQSSLDTRQADLHQQPGSMLVTQLGDSTAVRKSLPGEEALQDEARLQQRSAHLDRTAVAAGN